MANTTSAKSISKNNGDDDTVVLLSVPGGTDSPKNETFNRKGELTR